MYVLNNLNNFHKHVQRIKVLVHIFNKLTFNTVLYPVDTTQIYFHDIISFSIVTRVYRKSDSLPLLPGSLPSWCSNPAWISVIDGSLWISPLAATEGCDFKSCLATRCMSSAVTLSETKSIYIKICSCVYLYTVDFSTGKKAWKILPLVNLTQTDLESLAQPHCQPYFTL